MEEELKLLRQELEEARDVPSSCMAYKHVLKALYHLDRFEELRRQDANKTKT